MNARMIDFAAASADLVGRAGASAGLCRPRSSFRGVVALLTALPLILGLFEPAAAKSVRNDRKPSISPVSALNAANDQARRRPESANFVDAAQIYDYAPGALYELYAAPEFLSTILLEEGETLVTSAAGDTTRWMMETAQAAGQKGSRTLILIKPVKSGIRTNLVLVTDRRTYLIEAIAQGGERAYSAQIAWRYTGRSSLNASGVRVPLDGLNFEYRTKVVKGRRPAWIPQRVFDDGHRTYVEFGEDLIANEAPPLFVIGAEGPELVNYRVLNNRYIVDQLFDRAELRLGDKRPQVVRIERVPNKRVPNKRGAKRSDDRTAANDSRPENAPAPQGAADAMSASASKSKSNADAKADPKVSAKVSPPISRIVEEPKRAAAIRKKEQGSLR